MPAPTDSQDKKAALFEVFRAAVWVDLGVLGPGEAQKAVEKAETLGISFNEVAEVVDQWDAKQCAAYFGENAIGPDLINAMKIADASSASAGAVFGYLPLTNYQKRGFYPKIT